MLTMDESSITMAKECIVRTILGRCERLRENAQKKEGSC
jgi:hypothetical protein